MAVRHALACGALLCGSVPVLYAQYPAVYLSYDQAKPVFEAFNEAVPPASAWAHWIAEADRATRARVQEGDETSLVNLLLFGTSFTREPRITSAQLTQAAIETTLSARLSDFERALENPGTNERLLFARGVIGAGSQVRTRILAMLRRTMEETRTYARMIDAAHALGDPSLEFAERSRLYRDRGLSSDTSLRTNFAVEQALRHIYAGRADTNAVRRVAVVGPGLDFTDKQEGYDVYPLQTIQPFAIADSLIQLGLAPADGLSVTALDLNLRVTSHIERAASLARQGVPYLIHLPIDDGIRWTSEFADYAQRFGRAIGEPVHSGPNGVPSSVSASIKVRVVGVRPSVVEKILPRDINITAQYLALPDGQRFDLILATNVFVYYDRLQQGLALAGVARMLKPGGVLLTNNALVEVPSNHLVSAGYSRTRYSDRVEDGDLIIWYQNRGR